MLQVLIRVSGNSKWESSDHYLRSMCFPNLHRRIFYKPKNYDILLCKSMLWVLIRSNDKVQICLHVSLIIND